MRCLACCVLSAILFTGCENAEHKAVRVAVERQIGDFPESSLADLYKSFFQDNFGPGHIVSDSVSAAAYIENELRQAGGYDRHYYEPAGCGRQFYRVSLALIADSVVPFDVYINAFLESVKDVGPVDIERWRDEWHSIVKVIDEMNLGLPDYEADKAAIDSLLDLGRYVSHHSRRYNRLYQPHYRLMRRDIFERDIKPLIDGSRVIPAS